jgi:signal transduction protein with GAF and PtsI domain
MPLMQQFLKRCALGAMAKREIVYRSDQNLEFDKSPRSPYVSSMTTFISVEDSNVDSLHEIGVRLATEDEFHDVLTRVVEFASALVKCDSCLIYVLEGEELVLRASKNPHPEVVDRLKLRVGEGITGWVAQHQEAVAVHEKASQDSRFQVFHELPEDSYEAFLSVPLMCRGRVVGVINLQHRLPHVYKPKQIRLISTIGFLVGAEIELARLEEANSHLFEQLQTRKIVERAKGILQRDFGMSEEQAYLTLQRQSRQKRKAMKELAEAIVLSDDVKGDVGSPDLP